MTLIVPYYFDPRKQVIQQAIRVLGQLTAKAFRSYHLLLSLIARIDKLGYPIQRWLTVTQWRSELKQYSDMAYVGIIGFLDLPAVLANACREVT